MSEFKVGDRVVVNECEAYSWLRGRCGTIFCPQEGELWGVELDKPILGILDRLFMSECCLDPIPRADSLSDITSIL